MTISSIPEEFDGIKFRSKGETRCAIFFHELNVSYEYEPQAYRVGDRGYLPDFRLFTPRPMWAEYKGTGGVDEEGERKFRTFIADSERGTLGVLLTAMRPRSVWDWECIVLTQDGHGWIEENPVSWCACPAGYHYEPRWPSRGCEACGELVEGLWNDRDSRLQSAYRKARAYRFWPVSGG